MRLVPGLVALGLVWGSACRFLPDRVGVGEADPTGPGDGEGDPEVDVGSPPPEVDDFIAAQMEAAEVPGLAVAIVKGGAVVWMAGYGLADVDNELPVTPDTLFMVGAIAKPVVATAVMQLVERRALWLDVDVNAWLPFGVHSPASLSQPVTLRGLLGHTAGVRDNWDALNGTLVDGDSPIPLADWVHSYFAEDGDWYDPAANFQPWAPGAGYEYTNIDTDLAAYVAEVAGGLSFEAWCRTHLFGPLDMKTTSWHLADLDPARLAVPYAVDERGEFVAYGHYGYAGYPEGTLRTSVRELGRFLAAMSQKGSWQDARILGDASVDEMFAIQAPTLAPDQAAGWYYEDLAPGRLLGHHGNDLGVATLMMLRPSDGVGVIVLANGDWNDTGALYQILYRLFEAAATI